MAALTCLSKFEPGQFGSSPGNVVIPTADVPFPATITGQAGGYAMSWGYAVPNGVVASRSFTGYGSSWGYAVK